ncbi:erythromycin esterase family protein [Mycolicibacterium pyrenivorans]|uniref:erythromycin esterase family protein n=1 Tax=Mycolicibacterium pyrenivorans TaxID=187102 RepID=UPI0021F278C1|nr:erythromycin esterase family protein [Mycolicibacterium pyrenivorans]MCV7154381.1 erythromycin esterase family protein [Mycolicibacterium pyrenivorans]
MHRRLGTPALIEPDRVSDLGVDDAASVERLTPLLPVVGDARVVALGEGAHFVSEYWTLRHQIIRFLHERAGFALVAMEFGLGEGLALAPWLRGDVAVGDLASISPAAVQWGAGDTMRFLRDLNTTAARTGRPLPLEFAGIDLPNAAGSFRPALEPLQSYLAAVDPDLPLASIRSITDRVDAGSGVTALIAWSRLALDEKDAVISGLAQVALRMRALQPHYANQTAPVDHRTALLLAEAALTTAYMLQAAHTRATGAARDLDSSARERFMADAVLAYLDRADKKIIVLAHNNHIQKTPVTFAGATYTLPMGRYLAQHLGDDYRVIGQTSTDDHVPDMVADPDSPVGFRVVDQKLPPPPEGSLEHALGGIDPSGRAYLLNLRNCSDAMALNSIRSQGGYVETEVGAAFDAVVTHPRITTQAGVGL